MRRRTCLCTRSRTRKSQCEPLKTGTTTDRFSLWYSPLSVSSVLSSLLVASGSSTPISQSGPIVTVRARLFSITLDLLMAPRQSASRRTVPLKRLPQKRLISPSTFMRKSFLGSASSSATVTHT